MLHRPIAELSNRAFPLHGSEACYAKQWISCLLVSKFGKWVVGFCGNFRSFLTSFLACFSQVNWRIIIFIRIGSFVLNWPFFDGYFLTFCQCLCRSWIQHQHKESSKFANFASFVSWNALVLFMFCTQTVCKPLVYSKLDIFSMSAINIYEMYISWSEPLPLLQDFYILKLFIMIHF